MNIKDAVENIRRIFKREGFTRDIDVSIEVEGQLPSYIWDTEKYDWPF